MMNLGKAKDFFSAYYEGSLDRGLTQSFESRLKEDAQLQAEYRAFERTMESLGHMGSIEIEPPADLHEKIAARLDRAIWEQKREKSPVNGLSWWKGLVMGAAIAAGVFVAFIGFSGKFHNGAANTAGIVPTLAASEQFSFASRNGVVSMSYPTVNHLNVVVRDAAGRVLSSVELNNQDMPSKPLVNPTDRAQLVSIETATDAPRTYVALPGHARDLSTTGKGSLKDLAVALAGHYGKPVVVDAFEEADKTTSWDFTSADAVDAANTAVKSLGLAIQEGPTGVVHIQKN
jgi:hypothetical protein